VSALETLYRALAGDPHALVLWVPGAPDPHLGAFASGTVDLGATEALIRRALPLPTVARLVLATLRTPGHLLAMRAWRGIVPGRGVGYVLTVGACPELRSTCPEARGSALTSTLEAWFRHAGMTESWVDTEGRNAAALGLYRKLGYRPVAEAFGQVLLRKVLA
jgi:ribosomal protein S18 acetylase RimI-like enzyme